MGGVILVLRDDEVFLVESLSVDYKEQKGGLFSLSSKSKYIRALDGINLRINEGQIIALIGKNGAGKSTLLRALTGLVRPSQGKITSRGRVILLAGTDPGFDLDASGRSNIRDLAVAYGLDDIEVDSFCQEIIDFNPDGIMFVDDLKDTKISSELYHSKLDAINDNYERVKKEYI